MLGGFEGSPKGKPLRHVVCLGGSLKNRHLHVEIVGEVLQIPRLSGLMGALESLWHDAGTLRLPHSPDMGRMGALFLRMDLLQWFYRGKPKGHPCHLFGDAPL